MIEKKIVGFIVNKTNYKDNDAIFNVLTSNQKETFNARGILKATSKNASSCNYFMVCEFIVQSKTEKSNQSLKSSSIIKYYRKPYEDILVSACYLAICNLLNQVNEDINGYDIAINCFDKLEENENPIDVMNYFLKALCKGLGYEPNLHGCIFCGNSNNLISFDFESGGFICNNCFKNDRFEHHSTPFLTDLYNFLKKDEYVNLDGLKANKLLRMYESFLNISIGLKTECIKFIFQCE